MRRRGLLGVKAGVLTLSATGSTVNGASGTTTFTVKYNDVLVTASTISISSNQSWATTALSSSNSTVTLTRTVNDSFSSSRTATITVSYQGASATYRLVQNASTWSLFSYYNTTWNISASGGSYTVYIKVNGVDANFAIDYTISSYSDFLTMSTKYNSSFNFSCAENLTAAGRSCFIKVTIENTTKTINFTQLAYLRVRFADGNTYERANWPSAAPIGIVIPGTNACISLKYMSVSSPSNGTTSKYTTCWGGYGSDIGVLNNITNTGNAISDMDGKNNTSLILSVDNNNSTAWQTASTISSICDNQYTHPAAQCCWRYRTTGTNQGDWYLPSAGQLYKVHSVHNEYSQTRGKLKSMYGSSVVADYDDFLLSSTEYSDNGAWWVRPGNGYVFTKDKNYINNDYYFVRAFLNI